MIFASLSRDIVRSIKWQHELSFYNLYYITIILYNSHLKYFFISFIFFEIFAHKTLKLKKEKIIHNIRTYFKAIDEVIYPNKYQISIFQRYHEYFK